MTDLPNVDSLPTYFDSNGIVVFEDNLYVNTGSNSTPIFKRISGGLALGNGSDGDVIITSDTLLTQDMNYQNLTINDGATLDTGGFFIYATETVLVNDGGIITDTKSGGQSNGAIGSTKHGIKAGDAGFDGEDGTGQAAGTGGTGGSGGGIVIINAKVITNNGLIHANGSNGSNGSNGYSIGKFITGGGGGGGAGGAPGLVSLASPIYTKINSHYISESGLGGDGGGGGLASGSYTIIPGGKGGNLNIGSEIIQGGLNGASLQDKDGKSGYLGAGGGGGLGTKTSQQPAGIGGLALTKSSVDIIVRGYE